MISSRFTPLWRKIAASKCHLARSMSVMILRTAVLVCALGSVTADGNEDSVSILSELPLQELLLQKKSCGREPKAADEPQALPLMSGFRLKKASSRGTRKRKPVRKFFHEEEEEEEEEDEKGYVYEKKEKKEKTHDILNTSLTALSYLAFGGYLVCMVVTTLRERKRRRLMMAYPTVTGSGNNNQMGGMFNQYITRRPIRIRFPAINIQQGKKRKKRSSDLHPYGYYFKKDPHRETDEEEEAVDDFIVYNF